MRSKKAFELSGLQVIVAFIILIGFALIYLVWMKDVRIFGERLTDYEICKFSNIENAKLKLKVGIESKTLGIKTGKQVIQERVGNKCKTEYITVPKGKELDVIAKKMAACWEQYLEGKEELFDTADNNYCAFCSVLTFEDKKHLKGLTNYLIEHDAPGKKVRYFQYLTRTVVTNDVYREIENEHLNDLHEISTSKPLAIIFTMGKNVYPGGLIKASSVTTGGIGAVAGGAIAGSVVSGLLIKGAGLCLALPVVGCIIGNLLVATVTLGGATTGAIGGYMIGSNYNPNLDTKVLLWPYTNEDLSMLQCTKLEGKDNLEIKKY